VNADEGIRAPNTSPGSASLVSLKEYYPQIDILFPEWLHVLTRRAIYRLLRVNHPFQVVETGQYIPLIDKVMPFCGEKAEMEVFRHQPFEPVTKQWVAVHWRFRMDPAARQTFRTQLLLI